MKSLSVCYTGLLCLLSCSISAVELIRHNGIEKSLDAQKYYFIDVLQLAVDKSKDKFGRAELQVAAFPMLEQRQFKSLNEQKLDVMWAMTSTLLEKQARPVRIPLLKGLLGYRVLVIRKKQQQQFSGLTHIEQLKQLTAVQGLGWTDVKILRYNGFKVEESSWYSSIYKSLDAGFYDYFPRSVLEAESELAHYQQDGLMIDRHHAIYYPTAIYFFVAKNNTILADRLSYGLNQALADGSFEQLFKQYPQHVKALNDLSNHRWQIHSIVNPILPPETPLQNKTLWYQVPG